MTLNRPNIEENTAPNTLNIDITIAENQKKR